MVGKTLDQMEALSKRMGVLGIKTARVGDIEVTLHDGAIAAAQQKLRAEAIEKLEPEKRKAVEKAEAEAERKDRLEKRYWSAGKGY